MSQSRADAHARSEHSRMRLSERRMRRFSDEYRVKIELASAA